MAFRQGELLRDAISLRNLFVTTNQPTGDAGNSSSKTSLHTRLLQPAPSHSRRTDGADWRSPHAHTVTDQSAASSQPQSERCTPAKQAPPEARRTRRRALRAAAPAPKSRRRVIACGRGRGREQGGFHHPSPREQSTAVTFICLQNAFQLTFICEKFEQSAAHEHVKCAHSLL